MTWRPTIGLEIHVELKTQTKMFCDSRNDPKETRPNTNICPVCMAHPGVLPVINKEAVHQVIRVGVAVEGEIADYTEFDRKNYFYPDIPKGYQISQYQFPLVKGGTLAGVMLTRVHLEEDTARSNHEGKNTRIDYNRAGVPLMELVTEPVIHDAETAGRFARELQILLRTLGASDANMEEGQMRVEANISVSKDDLPYGTFGTKVEVKNLNSFRSVEKAIAYEIERQVELLENGGQVVQETRGWDEIKEHTFAQRKKESSHDYRYFPDPDLPKLRIRELSELSLQLIKEELPELPWHARKRYLESGLSATDAEILVQNALFACFFTSATSDKPHLTKLSANYLLSDIVGLIEKGVLTEEWLREDANAKRFSELMQLVSEEKISSRGAKNILELFGRDSRDVHEIARSEDLFQKSDIKELEELVNFVIAKHKAVAEEFKAGKGQALQFLIGQAMKSARGSANPQVLKELFEKILL